MSELAQKLIEENKRTKAKMLDLANCGLAAIPPDVGKLFWLEELHFVNVRFDLVLGELRVSANRGPANQPLTDLKVITRLTGLRSLSLTPGTRILQLSQLTALQSLYLDSTKVSDLKPLASLSALQLLNLGSTQVSDLTPLASLSNLQSLDLGSTQVSDLTPLASLSNLQSLYLLNTQVRDLTPLASLSNLQLLNLGSTQVSDLTPLASLFALQSLYLLNTQVRDLTPLASLSNLQSLDLDSTQVSDLTPLASLSNLQSLYLSGTQVSDLTPLASLSNLQSLDLGSTQVSDLTPLASLTALKSLNLQNTKVSDISALIPLLRQDIASDLLSREYFGQLGILLAGCPLTNPPLEIVQQGTAAVLSYFAEREKTGVDRLYEAKMLLVGEGSAGKTTLLRRLYQPKLSMPAQNESTKGIAIYRHSFVLPNGRKFVLNVWDFGGQEIYHATHQFFLTNRSLYVLLDDTRKDDKTVQDPTFRNWLGLVEVFGGRSPVLIFQNEKSGRSKQIDLDGIQSRYPSVRAKYQGDLAKPQAADGLRKAIEHFAQNLEHIGEELPAAWIKVRGDLEKLATSTAHITQQQYFDLYREHLDFVEDRALVLSQYLHDLGVFLHFQKDLLLKGIVILQNEWATQAVFRILDDEIIKQNLGRFREEDCARLWKDSAYAAKHAELLALMQNFELCYQLPDKSPREWLVPQLLPPGKPDEVKNWNKQNNLVLRYRYEFLPKGAISRLTVRLHRFVKRPAMAWTTGVLFERETTQALVELLPDGKQIEIRAQGPEAVGLLSAVSYDLDALNESFEGLRSKVSRLVPCPCDACSQEAEPEFYDHAGLVRRIERQQSTVECGRSYQNIEVIPLLYQLPGWAPKQEVGREGQILHIFLASSSELRDDRDAFELYLRQRNDELRKQGVYLEIVRWENFLDAMSPTRLQDEYNIAVKACDIFVTLYFTKVGKYTDEEFAAAWGQFKASGKPRIFTYFKKAAINTGDLRRADVTSLLDFQEKLQNLGHYQSSYENLADLKLQIRDQLDRLIAPASHPKAKHRGA